jgi:hypothetical protein
MPYEDYIEESLISQLVYEKIMLEINSQSDFIT